MIRYSRVCHAVLGSALLAVSHLALADAPVGVRPCCAFGKDLKAQVGNVPVPFFSVGNVLAADEIGNHIYNDGSQGVSRSLLGLGDEHNGLIFTTQGGFIDTAHVRDTADFTYYLFGEIRQKLGTDAVITLPNELRQRAIVLKQNTKPKNVAQADLLALDIAGVMAFRLAQWHEIAQWFGMESVSGFKEFASAFSPEDLYSNMLGATLAMEVLRLQPDMDVKAFGREMDRVTQRALKALGAVSASETTKRIDALDGKWWDSSKRLPDKWVLRKRDYDLSLSLSPNGVADGTTLQLSEDLHDGGMVSDWAQFELRKTSLDGAFAPLPAAMKAMNVWTPEQFQRIADIAKSNDAAALKNQ